jgi:hypothetical protein
MKESRKEFIKKAHSAACSEWKTNIENEFPKLFKEDALVVGEWYKYPDFENWKVLITDNTKGKEKGVGINCSGDWMKNWLTIGGCELDRLIPCPDKEVEQALIKEAKRLGVKVGAKVRCLVDESVVTVQEMEFSFCKISGDFWVKQEECGLWCLLFEDGVWATIIENTITKEEAEKELGKTIVD